MQIETDKQMTFLWLKSDENENDPKIQAIVAKHKNGGRAFLPSGLYNRGDTHLRV